MENIIETKEYRGYTINIYPDYDARYDDCDHLGTFYTNVPRELNPDGHIIDEILDENNYLRDDEYICVVVYAYIHGGIALSVSKSGQFSDLWDSGVGGVMAISKERAKKEFGYKIVSKSLRTKVRRTLIAEINELDAYCQGRVYGYEILGDDER